MFLLGLWCSVEGVGAGWRPGVRSMFTQAQTVLTANSKTGLPLGGSVPGTRMVSVICCRPVPPHFSHWGWVAVLEIFPALCFQRRDLSGADLVALGELDRFLGRDGAFGVPVFGYLVLIDGFVVLVHDSSAM